MILGCISFGTIENSWIYLNESQIKYRSKEQAKIFEKFTLNAVSPLPGINFIDNVKPSQPFDQKSIAASYQPADDCWRFISDAF